MLSMEKGVHPTQSERAQWLDVCQLADILIGTGVAALVAGQQVAIFRLGAEGPCFALGNFDPFSRAFVMARGIVGDKAGILKVASPIYKQSFELASGHCLDDPNVSLPTYPVRVVDNRVQVQVQSLHRVHSGARA